MDAFTLPPPPAMPGAMATPPGLPQPTNDGNNLKPIGRPSNDPAKDEERLMAQYARNKLQAVLPKESTDSRISVYRYKYRSNTRSPRPAMRFTVSELEDAINSGQDSKEYITGKVRDKFERGRFVCIPEDNKGSPLPKYASWEINLEEQEDDMPTEFDDGYDGPPSGRPSFSPVGTPPPPSGSPSDPGAFLRDAHAIIAEENERAVGQGKDMTALLMTTMSQAAQSQQAQMMAMMQQMTAAQVNQTQMFVAMMTNGNQQKQQDEERRRQEENQRMERERERKNDLFKVLTTTLIPIVTPLIAKMTQDKPDVLMPLILDMLKTKDNNSSAKELMTMMNAAAQQQIQLQGEVSRQAMGAAAETNKAMMTHVLALSQDVTRAMLESAGDDDDDPLDKFGKVMKAIGPILSQAGQPTSPPPPMGPVISPAAIDAAAALDHQNQPGPGPEAVNAVPAHVATEPERIRGCLHTMMQLEQNRLPANERVWALDWCRKNMPPDMLAAVAAGQEDRIMALAQPVVAGDQILLQWISGDGVADWVMSALKDVQRLSQSDVRMVDAKRIVDKQLAHLKARNLTPLMSPKPIWSVDPVEPPRRRNRLPSEDGPAPEAVPSPVAAPAQASEPVATPAPATEAKPKE